MTKAEAEALLMANGAETVAFHERYGYVMGVAVTAPSHLRMGVTEAESSMSDAVRWLADWLVKECEFHAICMAAD